MIDNLRLLRRRPLFVSLLVFLVLAAGAYLRFGAVADTTVIAPVRADARHYVSYALNILEHGVYSRRPQTDADKPVPDALRPPVYPLFLAAVFADTNAVSIVRVIYLQALISILTILLSYYLFRNFLGFPLAWTATLLVALSPHLVIANVYLLTETLFTFALVATLLITHRAYVAQRPGFAFLAGIVLGLLNLTRAAVQYLWILLATLYAWQGMSRKFILLFVLGFAVVFGMWAMRNVIATGSTSDSKQMINFLHHGMYPDFKYQGQAHTFGFPYKHDPESPRISRSVPSILREIAARFRDDPSRYLRWYLTGKPIRFWQWGLIQSNGDVYIYPVETSPYFIRPVFQWTYELSKLVHWPLVVLGWIGVVVCWIRSGGLSSPSQRFAVRLVASMIIYYQLIHIVGAPFPRYSIPLRPLMYGMALYAIQLLITRLLARGGKRKHGAV